LTLNLRIPGWAEGQPVPSDLYRYENAEATSAVKVKVNGNYLPGPGRVKGFLPITRRWNAGDTVELTLPLVVNRVVAHSAVKANRDRFAIERGPLVYCAEGADNDGRVLDKAFPGKVRFETDSQPQLLGGMTTIKMISEETDSTLQCIPYYAWCHRGPNEMRVWFPTK
jgi:uncharacterized protein